jgi:hypothetical protein
MPADTLHADYDVGTPGDASLSSTSLATDPSPRCSETPFREGRPGYSAPLGLEFIEGERRGTAGSMEPIPYTKRLRVIANK